jgi:hypothetical protein
MFGGTLTETMEIQRDRFPQRRLPWILTALADQVFIFVERNSAKEHTHHPPLKKNGNKCKHFRALTQERKNARAEAIQ